MLKFLSGLISFFGIFLMFGAVGSIEANTMPLLIGTPLAFAGAFVAFVGLEMLNKCGVNVWE